MDDERQQHLFNRKNDKSQAYGDDHKSQQKYLLGMLSMGAKTTEVIVNFKNKKI